MATWVSLPAGYLSNAARTNAEMQTAFEAWLSLTKKLAGAPKGASIVLDGGGTMNGVTSLAHHVIPNVGLSDTLSHISTAGVEAGHVLIVSTNQANHTITVAHSFEIQLEGDANFVMDGIQKQLMLILEDASSPIWREVGRCWGDDTAGYAAHIGAVSANNTALTGNTTAEQLDISDSGQSALRVSTGGGARIDIGNGRVLAASGNLELVAPFGDIMAGAGGGHRVLTENDEGSGGGLDADTLDTYHATGAPPAMWDGGTILCEDIKALNQPGGNAPATAVTVRTLNNKTVDTAGIGTLAANRIQVPAGSYLIHASAPAYNVENHKIYLWSVTAGSAILEGTPEYAVGTQTRSVITGIVTPGVTTQYEIRHYTKAAQITNGLGVACNYVTQETYTQLLMRRIRIN